MVKIFCILKFSSLVKMMLKAATNNFYFISKIAAEKTKAPTFGMVAKFEKATRSINGAFQCMLHMEQDMRGCC